MDPKDKIIIGSLWTLGGTVALIGFVLGPLTYLFIAEDDTDPDDAPYPPRFPRMERFIEGIGDVFSALGLVMLCGVLIAGLIWWPSEPAALTTITVLAWSYAICTMLVWASVAGLILLPYLEEGTEKWPDLVAIVVLGVFWPLSPLLQTTDNWLGGQHPLDPDPDDLHPDMRKNLVTWETVGLLGMVCWLAFILWGLQWLGLFEIVAADLLLPAAIFTLVLYVILGGMSATLQRELDRNHYFS